jgi:hypothetical protein
MKALALTAALLTGCGWSHLDRALAVTSTATLMADWHQTRSTIVPACREWNPVIGECGQRVHPDLYFGVVVVANLALAHVLGSTLRGTWLAGLTGVQGHTVFSNHIAGY